MIKFVAIVNGEQFETLLLAARAVGVTPHLDVVPSEALPRRYTKRKEKRSTNRRRKPKRYKANLQVRIGKAPEGPPKLIEVHQALKKTFGGATFRKGDAKGAVAKQLNGMSATGHISKLMDMGGLVAV